MTPQSNPSALMDHLYAETIKGLALALESMNHVQSSNSPATTILRVGHRVTDQVLEEDPEYTTGFLVDETRYTLDTATTSETAYGGLGDALDVITKDLAVA
eukprot:CAMPEP_0201664064 /NCGR_PEP_ID=MMETSP0494-20130426/5658_1 /ASSEMBLY_ACC=CAM_ASM_000839 /TAXON_ID=420259 /ORGANISM="Thalassiosira gravida, Strain GMp14c1" /LENGTH=100 /DNA_ID=CAMNT_0048142775 /DNA_START=390 /DNA_END=688 /DNA_ORIENTATION=+